MLIVNIYLLNKDIIFLMNYIIDVLNVTLLNINILRQIARRRRRRMLQPEKEASRKYVISFDNNYLLRGIMKSLDEKGFLPIKD